MATSNAKSPVLVVTTPDVPGRKIAHVHGIATGIGTGSGKTARPKTVEAYGEAISELRDVARSLGANAVVALQQSSHGASLGGAGFGDASVVIFTGTAVTLE